MVSAVMDIRKESPTTILLAQNNIFLHSKSYSHIHR